jgi:ribosome maturation factor RimP
MQEQERAFAELEGLLSGAGLRLVELGLSRHHGSLRARAVVYAPGGTGIEECACAHRIARAMLQERLGEEDPYLEVSSPGIDRVLKSPREWAIFRGKGVRVLPVEGGDWISGRIGAVEGGKVVIAGAGGEAVLDIAGIAKARLDSSQEGD